MFLHYIKFAFRSLLRNKIFSLINLTGLAIGLACSFYISMFVINELSFDNFHENKDRIYRITTDRKDFNMKTACTPIILSESLKEKFPEIERIAVSRNSGIYIEKNEETISENILFIQKDFPDIFSIDLIQGDKETPLSELNSLIISEKFATKHFPDEDPIGKSVKANFRGDEINFIVRAVMKDFKWNSTIYGNMIADIQHVTDNFNNDFDGRDVTTDWHSVFFTTHILLEKNTSVETFGSKLEVFGDELKEREKFKFSLQPLEEIYLHSNELNNNAAPSGSLSKIYIFSGVAFLILIIACINFIILSTAKASTRAKEIGLRKVFGASRKKLISQLLGESIMLSFIALPISYLLVEIFLPQVNQLFGRNLEFQRSNLIIYISSFILIASVIGILSGSYIAFYISSFKPIDALKNLVGSGKNNYYFRKTMIIFQLIIFIALLISSLTIHKQIGYGQQKDLGLNKKDLLIIEFDKDKFSGYEAYINSIKSNPNIINISYAFFSPPANGSMVSLYSHFEKPDIKVEVEGLSVGYNYTETFEFKLVAGRSFSKDFGTDLEEAVILNETAVKELGITDPINKKLGSRTIIGVVSDIHIHSLRNKIKPLSIDLSDKYVEQVIVRIKPENQQQTIAFLKEKWKEVAPNIPFNLDFFDTKLKDLYHSDRKFARITTVFTIMAIFIASLGLFGLTLFIIQKRSKEIGIRKVHGASINNIMMMINKEFAILVCIATVLAWPVAWYFMDKWLQSFAYTIKLPIELYILSGLMAMLIVLTTVSIRSIKAASKNPVDAIRHE